MFSDVLRLLDNKFLYLSAFWPHCVLPRFSADSAADYPADSSPFLQHSIYRCSTYKLVQLLTNKLFINFFGAFFRRHTSRSSRSDFQKLFERHL